MGFFKKAILGVGGLIVLIIIIAVASSGGSKSGSTSAPATGSTGSSSSAPASAPAQLSNTGVSSNVTITVKGESDADSIGDQSSGVGAKATGVFKIVTVSVSNHQTDAITVDSNSFKLVDDKGNQYSASTEAQTALDMQNGGDTSKDLFLKSLNPNLTITGQVAFDVPKDAKIAYMEAHGGMMGDAIKLKVN